VKEGHYQIKEVKEMAEPIEEFLRLFEVRPEEASNTFAELVGGAGATAVFDGILQSIFLSNPDFWRGQVLFWEFMKELPSVDDWIVAGIPGFIALLGALTGNKDLFRTGVGGGLYGGGMLLHQVIVRNLPKLMPTLSSSLGQEVKFAVKPQGRYQVTR
jgi:hypothetical protein